MASVLHDLGTHFSLVFLNRTALTGIPDAAYPFEKSFSIRRWEGSSFLFCQENDSFRRKTSRLPSAMGTAEFSELWRLFVASYFLRGRTPGVLWLIKPCPFEFFNDLLRRDGKLVGKAASLSFSVCIIDEDWNTDSSGAVRKFVSESQVFPGNDEIIMCCFCHVIARSSAKFCQCRYGTDRQIFLVHVRQPAETLNRHQCVKSWFAAFWKKQSGSANDARNVEKLRHIFIRKMIAFWPLLNLISSMGIPLKEQVFKSRTEGAEAFSNAADLLSLSLFIRKSKEARSFRPGPSGFFFGISAGIR